MELWRAITDIAWLKQTQNREYVRAKAALFALGLPHSASLVDTLNRSHEVTRCLIRTSGEHQRYIRIETCLHSACTKVDSDWPHFDGPIMVELGPSAELDNLRRAETFAAQSSLGKPSLPH